jgi:PleD family two-component response regulator
MSATILVIEDQPMLMTLLTEILTGEGYQVIAAFTGEDGLARAAETTPDLVLLDLSLPGMDGFAVLHALRAEPRTQSVPVIILTGDTDMRHKLHAFNIYHVHDFLNKPFNNDELLARVSALVRNAQMMIHASPLTRLPSGPLIEHELEIRMLSGAPWAFLYIDLDHFKALNDGYGFWRGNEMIRLLSWAIQQSIATEGNADDFIGHIGGEDFVVLTTPERIHPICQGILAHFVEGSRHFYRSEDLARGGFVARGRQGTEELFPLVTVSIAAIPSSGLGTEVTLQSLSQRAALIKTRSKAATGNCYYIDGEDHAHSLPA